MPSKTEKQKRFMAAAAHDSDFARRNDIPQDVAREFNDADMKHPRVCPNGHCKRD